MKAPQRMLKKLSALHPKHLSMGAKFMEEGGWLVPESFGDSHAEVGHLKSACGIVDWSSQRKWEMVGRESKVLLSQIPQINQVPAPGRLTKTTNHAWIGGLTANSFFILAKSNEGDQTGEIFSPPSFANRCVHLTEMTSSLAGFALKGKKVRPILQKVTPLNLTEEASPPLTCAMANVAGVQAVLLRLDSLPLEEYALYVSRDYAEYVYDCLLEAGRDLNLRPVGLRAYELV
jgi:glycine cleavage system aminomethyltransferase T